MSARRSGGNSVHRLRDELTKLSQHMSPRARGRAEATLALDDAAFSQAAHDAHLDLQVKMADRAMNAPRAPVPSYFSRQLLRPAGLAAPPKAFKNWLNMQEWYDSST